MDPRHEKGAGITDTVGASAPDQAPATAPVLNGNGGGIPGSAAPSGSLEALLASAEDIVGSAHSVIEVYRDRFRLSWRRKITRAALVTAASICAAVWLSAAALAALRGICGGFTALFDGRVWLGELTGAVFALSLTAGAVALYLQHASHIEIVRLKAKYKRIRNEPR